MRIVYVLPYVIWPVKVTSANLVPRLARDHEVHVVCLTQAEEESKYLQALSTVCASVRAVPHSKLRGMASALLRLPTSTPLRIGYCHNPEMARVVQRTIGECKPDVICVERWRALQYVPRDCGVPVLCHPIDSMLLYNRRLLEAGAWWEKLVGLEESWKFQKFEGELARRANLSVFCSNIDLQVVRQLAPQARLGLVPNGVDCQQFAFKQESEEQRDTIVFTGSFRYRPNQHGASLLLNKIFPQVRNRVPSAKLLLVGNGARDFVGSRGNLDGVEVHDFVPELRPYVARGTVAIVPITVASGVSCKLLEAFSTGTPVVSTKIACGDLPVVDGTHLFIADDEKLFAERVISLMSDAILRTRMRTAARKFVEENYEWEIVTKILERHLERLCEKRGSTLEEQSAFAPNR